MTAGFGPTRLRRLAGWLEPSAFASCVAVWVTGILEARLDDTVATVGFVALFALPLVALVVLGRGIFAAWQPRPLRDALVEDGGGAPVLAGWLVVLGIGVGVAAGAAAVGVRLLAEYTAFKPLVVSFAEPAMIVAAVLLFVAVSRPAAYGIAWLVRVADRRWRRAGRTSLVTPRRIVAGALVGAAAIGSIVLHRALAMMGPFDLEPYEAPVAGLAAGAVAHAVWPIWRRWRARIARSLLALTLAASLFAVSSTRLQPELVLSIWADRPVAGLVVDTLFDLDDIRANVSLANFQPVGRSGARHPDVVLITIDTVRADHTPPYGGHAAMPFLDGLAKRGTVFDWAFSPSNVTRRSIPSMIIGLQPNRVRGRVVGWSLRIDPRYVLLAERFESAGYDTAGFLCCEGFWGTEFHTGLSRGIQHLELEHDGNKLSEMGRKWIAEREATHPQRPLFLWMHLIEPHNWLEGHVPRDDEDRKRIYDMALAASDRMAQTLVSAFSHRAPEDVPLVIVTADHGEGLGEHGNPYHSTDLYDSQTHVPFVIAGPGVPAQRVTEAVSLTDLTPTLLDLAGYDAPRGADIDGHSLADLVTGKRPSDDDAGFAYLAMIKDRSNPGGVTAVVHGRYKLIRDGTAYRLFDYRSDSGELHDLSTTEPAVLRELRDLLDKAEALGDRSPFR